MGRALECGHLRRGLKERAVHSNNRLGFFAAAVLAAAMGFAACNCGAPATCQSSSDCASTQVCLGTQVCAAKCSADADCAGGEKCSAAGGCVAATSCGGNVDCPSNQACTASGTCAQRCAGPTDCGASGACLDNGTCAPKCTAASDCKAGEKCSTTGGCVPITGCGANADCSTGLICDQLGRCVTDCRQGTCNPGAYCTSGGVCMPTNNPDGGAPNCGGELFQAAKVNSNMLIALDKSGSMSELIAGQTKWAIATAAVRQVTSQYESQIQFGLLMFPAGGTTSTQCVPQPVSVTVGDQRAAAISVALDGGAPGGRTPIGATLTACGNVAELADPNRANYVMLVTDGMETCGGNGVTAATNNLAQKGIKTFVVGFGSGVAPANLSNIATAGGTPRPGTPKYYQADDAAGLQLAFNQIAQGALGCEYKLAAAPPDPSKIFVYVNGVLQNQDPNHANGWDYSAATVRITFYGALCNMVATDPTAKVSIVYGCRDDGLVEKNDGGAKLPNGAACVVNTDCLNALCVNGICGKGQGAPCTTAAECASQVCSGGTCQPGIN